MPELGWVGVVGGGFDTCPFGDGVADARYLNFSGRGCGEKEGDKGKYPEHHRGFQALNFCDFVKELGKLFYGLFFKNVTVLIGEFFEDFGFDFVDADGAV